MISWRRAASTRGFTICSTGPEGEDRGRTTGRWTTWSATHDHGPHLFPPPAPHGGDEICFVKCCAQRGLKQAERRDGTVAWKNPAEIFLAQVPRDDFAVDAAKIGS